MLNRLKGGQFALGCLLLLAGCASEVTRHPAELIPAPAAVRYVLTRPLTVELDSGYTRSVPAGTEFVEVGSVQQGKVLRRTDGGVFTVEGAHVHEAYPVVQSSRLVGFYLPVEKAFSPLAHPIAVPIEERGAPK